MIAPYSFLEALDLFFLKICYYFQDMAHHAMVQAESNGADPIASNYQNHSDQVIKSIALT